MAYGTPADPVAGTVITVAYAIANILDPIRALRAFTGGSDPPGSNYWLRSTSTSAVSWVSRAAEVLAAIGYTPVNKAGDTMSGNLIFSTSETGFVGSGGSRVRDSGTSEFQLRVVSGKLVVYDLTDDSVILRVQDDGTFQFRGATVWTSANDGASSGLDADTLQSLTPGNASTQIPRNNNTLNTNLIAHYLGVSSRDSAFHLARANHSGTQLAATISDLATEILARSKHSGTQLAATISDLATAVSGMAAASAATASNALAISDGAVSTAAKIADGIVTYPKAASSFFVAPALYGASSDQALTSTFADIAGCSHTTTRAGSYLVTAHALVRQTGILTTGEQHRFRIQRTGSSTVNSKEAPAARSQVSSSSGEIMSASWIVTAPTVGDVIRLQGLDVAGTGGGNNPIEADYTWMTVAWISP